MTYLEPRRVNDQEIIYLELDDVSQIDFFLEGNIDLGYEMDKKKVFKLRFKKFNVIGSIYATFDRKALFICKAASICTGFMIRKGHWLRILQNYPDISKPLKYKIIKDFQRIIRRPMMLQKNRDIEILNKRSNYQRLYKCVEVK
jgi:hypothetical protein